MNTLSIIIYSCWRNSDMWDIFSDIFRKYWSDCPYQVVLVTDYAKNRNDRWVFDKIIEFDATWGSMILNALSVINSRYVMLWMDDYLLCDYVDNDKMAKSILIANENHVGNLRLSKTEFVKRRRIKKGISIIPYKQAYAFSTQIGIWDCRFLKKHIKTDWSAWDFERVASLEISDLEFPILAWNEWIFPYIEGVRKGKWMKEGVDLCLRNGIYLNQAKRPIMSNMDMAIVYFKGAMLEFNPTVILKLQNLKRKVRGGIKKKLSSI